MKRTLLFAASCLMLLSACKKDGAKQSEETNKPEVRYPVSFDVSQFNQTMTPLSIKQTSGHKLTIAPDQIEDANGALTPLPGIGVLMYAVYDASGNLVSRLKQEFGATTKTYRIINGQRKLSASAAGSTFGGFKDTLAAGTYTVIVAGSPMVPLMLNSGQEGINGVAFTSTPLSSALMNYQDYLPFRETYLYKGILSVSAGMASQTLKMSRIVGGIEVYMEDTPPATAKTFTCDISPLDHAVYKVSDGTTLTPIASNFNPNGVVRNVSNITTLKGLIADYYRLNMSNATITVTFYDANNNIILQKAIPNITVKPNQLTKVTGKMFNSVAPFKIELNSVWTNTTINY